MKTSIRPRANVYPSMMFKHHLVMYEICTTTTTTTTKIDGTNVKRKIYKIAFSKTKWCMRSVCSCSSSFYLYLSIFTHQIRKKSNSNGLKQWHKQAKLWSGSSVFGLWVFFLLVTFFPVDVKYAVICTWKKIRFNIRWWNFDDGFKIRYKKP